MIGCVAEGVRVLVGSSGVWELQNPLLVASVGVGVVVVDVE